MDMTSRALSRVVNLVNYDHPCNILLNGILRKSLGLAAIFETVRPTIAFDRVTRRSPFCYVLFLPDTTIVLEVKTSLEKCFVSGRSLL